MGRPVTITVDEDDIEALLFGTSAVKGIEEAIKASRTDDFGVRTKGRLTSAHDNIANAWRGAKRELDMPERFETPRESDVRQMIGLWPAIQDRRRINLRYHPLREYATATGYRNLLLTGLIEYGVLKEVTHWSSSGETTSGEQRQMMRPTKRGLRAIYDLELKDMDHGLEGATADLAAPTETDGSAASDL